MRKVSFSAANVAGDARMHWFRPLMTALLVVGIALGGCSTRKEEEWSDPLPARNEAILDSFFLSWAGFAMQHLPASTGDPPSPDPMLVAMSQWQDVAQSDGEVTRVPLSLFRGLDLVATASLGHVIKVMVSFSTPEEETELSREYFVAACEATVYAMGRDDIASDPESVFVSLLTSLEADSRVRYEGKIPSASQQYNGCTLTLTSDQEQTSLQFIAQIAARESRIP